MIPNLSMTINICFILVTLVTVWFLYEASHQSKIFLVVAIGWLVLQAVLGFSKFYLVSKTLPPRFALLGMPPLVLIAVMFATQKGRIFIDSLDLKTLTFLHVVRIAVEFILLNLSIQKLVPQLMTFEGRNFDIISGITAPFIYYFGFVKPRLGRKFLLAWNSICLALLLNIVINAVLALPSAFQQFAFEQPNVAVLYFPFVWLPCCVVPIVLFSHLAAIRQLLNKNKFNDSLQVILINKEQNIQSKI